MEARARVAVERLAHERGEQALLRGEVLDGGLEAERAVGGVERLGVREVDLPLAHAVLVRGTDRPEVRVGDLEQHAVEHAARIGVGADGVDVGRILDVARPAAGDRRAGLQQVELELGAHHRREAELRESGDRALQRRARVGAVGLAVGRLIRQAPGHSRVPRHAHERVEQRRHVDVAEPVLEAGDDVVAQVDRGDRLAEVEAGLGDVGGEDVDRYVLAAQHAVQVGVGDAHDAHALLLESLQHVRPRHLASAPIVARGGRPSVPAVSRPDAPRP